MTTMIKKPETRIKTGRGRRLRRDRGISYFAGILLGIVLAVVVYVVMRPTAETGMNTATTTATNKLNTTLQ